MLFSDLTKENNTFETTIACGNGSIKDKSVIIDEETIKKFMKDNKIVSGHLLNHMTNPLFNLFVTFKFAKIIWEKLKVKHGASGTKKNKYVVSEWLSFQITYYN